MAKDTKKTAKAKKTEVAPVEEVVENIQENVVEEMVKDIVSEDHSLIHEVNTVSDVVKTESLPVDTVEENSVQEDIVEKTENDTEDKKEIEAAPAPEPEAQPKKKRRTMREVFGYDYMGYNMCDI